MVPAQALCLSCRHYDANPGLGGDLAATYGMCMYRPEVKRAAVTMLWLDIQTVLEKKHTRLVPKYALAERPDLWSKCEAYSASTAGATP